PWAQLTRAPAGRQEGKEPAAKGPTMRPTGAPVRGTRSADSCPAVAEAVDPCPADETVLPPARAGMSLVQDPVKAASESSKSYDATRQRAIRLHWPGLLVLLVAFGARRIRVAPEFVSSDAADLPATVLRLLCGPTPFQEVFEKLAL